MRDFIWVIILVILSSCSEKDTVTVEELRQREIEKRVNQFILSKEQECREKTMEQAYMTADSLLKLNAVKYSEDSLKRPLLPLKPEKKIKPLPKDSVQNRPFIEPDTVQ